MKKISVIAFAGVMCAFAANAATADAGVDGNMPAPNAGGAGFVGEETFVSVSNAKNMPDDTMLVLRGNIIKSLGDEKYIFQDETDTITVEIDDDDWRGMTITPTDTVVLYGEVDAGPVTEIEVTRIEMM